MEEIDPVRNPVSNGVDAVVVAIKQAKNILISVHLNPDGDTLGSSLALFLSLRKIGKNVTLVSADPIPDIFKFLPGIDLIVVQGDCPNFFIRKNGTVPIIFDVAITVECPTIDRVGNIEKIVNSKKNVKTIINIDHHPGNSYFGDVNYVDSKASAVGEQIFKLIKKLKTKFDKDIATCLYVSILTDTGSFLYANTTSKTHLIVSELLKYGIDPSGISSLIYENKSIGKLKLLSKALNSISISRDGQISWIVLTNEMLKETNTKASEADGFVNYPRSIKGVEVAILFREADEGRIRVSLRSNGKINVNEIAKKFNGGGHERAAGCTVNGTLNDVVNSVLKEVSA